MTAEDIPSLLNQLDRCGNVLRDVNDKLKRCEDDLNKAIDRLVIAKLEAKGTRLLSAELFGRIEYASWFRVLAEKAGDAEIASWGAAA